MYNNKKIISFALGVSLMLVGSKCFAETGVVNTETLKLREEASTSSNIVKLLSENDEVEIIEKSGDWYKVKSGSDTGFVSAQYIKTDEKTSENNTTTNTTDNSVSENVVNNTNAEEDVEEANTDNTQNVEVSSDIEINSMVTLTQDIQIKITPLITSNVIGTAKTGNSVMILDKANGWYFILYDNIEGWVRKEKISEEEVTETQTSTEETIDTENSESAESTEEDTTSYKYVNESSVNLRASASKDGNVLKSVSLNTEVIALGVEGEWTKVKVNDTEGYIFSELLSDAKVSDTQNTTNRSLEVSRIEVVSEKDNTGIVDYAKSYLGTKYVKGGSSPSGFDCSGFTKYIYSNYGVNLPSSTSGQANAGIKVEKSDMQVGDLIIFNNSSNSSVGHVGIYIGNNQFIHASNPGDVVKITSLSLDYYSKRFVSARRVL